MTDEHAAKVGRRCPQRAANVPAADATVKFPARLQCRTPARWGQRRPTLRGSCRIVWKFVGAGDAGIGMLRTCVIPVTSC
jgi:hypothetical protein